MKSFDEIYNKLATEKATTIAELEKLRKRQALFSICLIMEAIALFTLGFGMSLGFFEKSTKNIAATFFLFSVTAISILLIASDKKYFKKFKKEIIEPFIKEVDSNLSFHPDGEISESTYIRGEFERYNEYHAEDLIEGILDGKYSVAMANVKTESVQTDDEGHTSRATIFHGIFGEITCSKPIPGFIKIHSDKGFQGALLKQENKIEMDSSEFEKVFDVYGTNPIMVMQILTADIMEMLVEFKKKSKTKYEITIKGGAIYIRFHVGEAFEPNELKKTLDYNHLKKYYDMIEFIFSVTRAINKAIEETEI